MGQIAFESNSSKFEVNSSAFSHQKFLWNAPSYIFYRALNVSYFGVTTYPPVNILRLKKKCVTMNDPSEMKVNIQWSAGTCVIVGDPIITRINDIRISKNRSAILTEFRGATLEDINHHIILILKRKVNVIILTLEQITLFLEPCEILYD